MREILFRGKRTDNKQWTEGFYALIGKENPSAYIIKNNGRRVRVAHKSISEYTGLMDKNGRKIFEGDIIKSKKYGKIIGHSNVNDYDIFEVIYEPAVFRLKNVHRGFNLVGISADYEVIGNIHDNPELLEVQK